MTVRTPRSRSGRGGTATAPAVPALAVAALSAAAVLAGCSSDSGGSADAQDAAADDPAAGALLDAAKTFRTAFWEGRADTAYAMLSPRCQAALPAPDFAAKVADNAAKSGGKLSRLTPTSFTVHAGPDSGDTGYVVIVDGTPRSIDDKWVLDAGKWRNDQC
ncbi:hypothetical protein GCM10023205_03190 [Yinghuangia aomiensis]|uniref:Lipoprotein n=1 Tax=Yinghuangia aomiensis TaxID=676205 RepID=A0ABP9GLE7_9ACTN